MKTIHALPIAIIGALSISLEARAQLSLPYTNSCSPGSGACFDIAANGAAALAGRNTSSVGVLGETSTGVGIRGVSSSTGAGVRGQSSSGIGIYGVSGTGLAGQFDGPVSVSGGPQTALSATTSHVGGVGLRGSANSTGVKGESSSGTGVHGQSTSGPGVRGESTSTTAGWNGVEGIANRNGVSGVYGVSNAVGYGVTGRVSPPSAGTAVYGDNTSTSGWAGYFNGRIYVAGTPFSAANTNFTIFSDARLKKDIKPLEGALDRLLQLRGVTFEWKEPEKHANMTGRQRGFIAQEVEKVMPEWVGQNADGTKTINTSGLDAMVVESLRTLKKENDVLRAQNAKFEDRLKALEGNRMLSKAGFTARDLYAGGLFLMASALVVALRKRAQK